MSAFTKVLILFVCLLSAIFAASQVVLYTKREHFGELYKQSQGKLLAVGAERDGLQAEAKEWKGKHDDVMGLLQGQVDRLTANLASERSEIQRLKTALDEQSRNAGRLTEVLEGLRVDIKTKDDTIAQLNDTVKERAGTIDENLASITALNTSVADRDAKVGALENELLEVKKDRKELAAARDQLEAMIGEAIARGISFAAVQVPPIDARVVRVDNDLGIAVIDKGSAAKVSPNTGFTIYRDDAYVASLVIHDVEEEVAVGRVILLGEGMRLQIGDSATTKVQ